MGVVFGAFCGALLSLMFSVYIEFQRKPKLEFTIESNPIDKSYSKPSIKRARFLRVSLHNRQMPILFRWLGRNAAMHCYGTIEFFDYENCIPVFSDPMPLRWADSKEPMTFLQLSHGQLKKVFDPTKFSSAEYCNVYPGSNEPIDVVAKFDVDEECYGWSNMNYLPDKTWRNKDWELRKMKYLVHVKVYTNGESKDALYVLDNTVLRCDCKLVEASKKDKARMK